MIDRSWLMRKHEYFLKDGNVFNRLQLMCEKYEDVEATALV